MRLYHTVLLTGALSMFSLTSAAQFSRLDAIEQCSAQFNTFQTKACADQKAKDVCEQMKHQKTYVLQQCQINLLNACNTTSTHIKNALTTKLTESKSKAWVSTNLR